MVLLLGAVWLGVGGWPISSRERAIREHERTLLTGTELERANAAIALGELRAKEALPALMDALLKDKSPRVRWEAAKALGLIGDERAVAPLIEALEDENPNVRMYSAYALGEIKSPRAVEALVRSLADREWLVRWFSCWALMEIRSPDSVKPLVSLLKRKEADTPLVVRVLEWLKHPKTTDFLLPLLKHRDEEVRARAAFALGRAGGPRAVEPLLQLLNDGSPKVRREAVLALARVGDRKVAGPLERLKAKEEDEGVRRAIEEAIFELIRREFERLGLVAYWSFDEGRGNIVLDRTRNGNDGWLEGGMWVRGKVGGAIEFGGKGEFVDVGKPKTVRIGRRPFTIMAWALPKAEEGVVVVYGGAWCGFSLYIKDGLPKFGISRKKDAPDDVVSGREKVVGRWVHLAGVVREGRMELYVDGKLVAQKSIPGFITSEPGQGMQIGFDLGDSPAETTAQFIGVIDEVKFFQRALSPEEIAQEAGLKGP